MGYFFIHVLCAYLSLGAFISEQTRKCILLSIRTRVNHTVSRARTSPKGIMLTGPVIIILSSV